MSMQYRDDLRLDKDVEDMTDDELRAVFEELGKLHGPFAERADEFIQSLEERSA